MKFQCLASSFQLYKYEIYNKHRSKSSCKLGIPGGVKRKKQKVSLGQQDQEIFDHNIRTEIAARRGQRKRIKKVACVLSNGLNHS